MEEYGRWPFREGDRARSGSKKKKSKKEKKAKKEKKLSKLIEGNLLTITEGVTGTVLKFDAATLPAEIQKKLMHI